MSNNSPKKDQRVQSFINQRLPIGVLTAGAYLSLSIGCQIGFTKESSNPHLSFLSPSHICPCPEDLPENPSNNFYPSGRIPIIPIAGVTGPAGNNSTSANTITPMVISGSFNAAK